jgi:hypothetical protein
MNWKEFKNKSLIPDDHIGRHGEWVDNGHIILHASLSKELASCKEAKLPRPQGIHQACIDKIGFNESFRKLPNMPDEEKETFQKSWSSWHKLGIHIDQYYIGLIRKFGLSIYYDPKKARRRKDYVPPLPIIKDGKIVGAVMGMKK